MKEERYAHSTVQFKPSVAAAMTVLLQRDLDGNARYIYYSIALHSLEKRKSKKYINKNRYLRG